MASVFYTDKRGNRASTSPGATVFFHPPPSYNFSNLENYTHHYLPNLPFVSEINQNPSYYYDYYYHPYNNLYYYTTNSDYEYPSNAQRFVTHSGYTHDDLLVSTAPDQTVQTEDETKVGVDTVSKNTGGCSRQVGSFNGRGGRGHRKKLGNKEYLRGKSNGSGQKHPVLPLLPDGQKTTVMIKNIPNRYTREMLMDFLDSHCMMENEKAKLQNPDSTKKTTVSAFDFLYLPIDFKSGSNKGYAFVNFTNARAAWKFFISANDQAWNVLHSKKIRQIVSATLQGKEQLIRQFDQSTFECNSNEYLPICFIPARDGSRKMGEQKTICRLINY